MEISFAKSVDKSASLFSATAITSSALYNEILAFTRMKSAMQMKSSAMPQMKLNPTIRCRAGFHPCRGFRRRRRFIPPVRVDLAEKTTVSIKTVVFSWYTGRDSFASAFCADKGSPPSSRRRQQSTGLLHLFLRVLPLCINKRRSGLYHPLRLLLVHRKGLEPPTLGTGIRCSIH